MLSIIGVGDVAQSFTFTTDQGTLREDITLPAIELTHLSFADQFVLSESRQQHSPDEPVNTTCCNDTPADNAVQVIGEVIVNVLAVIGRDKRCKDEVEVADKEDQSDWDGRTEGRVPVPASRVPVQVQQSTGDKDIDHRQRICDDVEDKVVRVARWWCQHDDDGYEPVLEQTCQWCIEGFVARPKSGKRQDAFSSKLLYKSSLGEDDAQNVAKG